jgi:hypothetical protein
MYAGLYIGALLSIAPLSLTVTAWRAERNARPPFVRWRVIAFRIGLSASLVCAIVSACCWLDLYFNALFPTALASALVSLILAFFGNRSSRLLLSGAAVIQLANAYLAILQNGV